MKRKDPFARYIKDLQARRTVEREYDQWQEFTLTTSYPPDTRVHMRGGQMWRGSYGGDGAGWTVDGASWDLTDYVNITYTIEGAYRGGIITLKYGGYTDVVPRFFWDTTDYETGQEAEEAALAVLEDQAPAYEDYPLAALVLRNNGDITVSNSFLAIDPINRGRSYLWMDVRPTHWA